MKINRISLAIVAGLALVAAAAASLFEPQALLALFSVSSSGVFMAGAAVGDLMPMLEKTVDSLKSWQERKDAEFGKLRADIDRIESKGNLHGLMGGGGPSSEAGREPTLQLRTKAEFIEYFRQKATADDLDGLTLTDFVRGAANMATSTVARKALAIGTDTSGGYAIPSLVMPEILAALTPASSLLSAGAGVVPVSAGAKTYTTAAVNVIPTAAWRLENGAVAESEPTFRAVVAAPQSLAFFFKVSRELLADAPNMDDVLRLAIAQSFAQALDLAGLRGSGTAPTPRGLLNTVGINAVTNGAAGASLATTKYTNFFTGAQAILEDNAPMPTAAIMSPRSRVVLGQLADSTGQPLQVPQMLSQVRLLTSSQVPNNLTVGASTDCSEIYLGDFARMAFIMRENVTIQPLTELFSGNGQIAFVGHVRADVAVWYPQAFAVVTGVRP
jgi:HK97 family phage major capsid protein